MYGDTLRAPLIIDLLSPDSDAVTFPTMNGLIAAGSLQLPLSGTLLQQVVPLQLVPAYGIDFHMLHVYIVSM